MPARSDGRDGGYGRFVVARMTVSSYIPLQLLGTVLGLDEILL